MFPVAVVTGEWVMVKGMPASIPLDLGLDTVPGTRCMTSKNYIAVRIARVDEASGERQLAE